MHWLVFLFERFFAFSNSNVGVPNVDAITLGDHHNTRGIIGVLILLRNNLFVLQVWFHLHHCSLCLSGNGCNICCFDRMEGSKHTLLSMCLQSRVVLVCVVLFVCLQSTVLLVCVLRLCAAIQGRAGLRVGFVCLQSRVVLVSVLFLCVCIPGSCWPMYCFCVCNPGRTGHGLRIVFVRLQSSVFPVCVVLCALQCRVVLVRVSFLCSFGQGCAGLRIVVALMLDRSAVEKCWGWMCREVL